MTEISRRNLLKWTVAAGAGAVVAAPAMTERAQAATSLAAQASVAQSGNPPYLLWCSDAVKPGELFSVSGEYLDPDTVALVVAPAAAAPRIAPPRSAVTLTTVQLDPGGHFAAASLPAGLQAGVYELWAKTAQGYSNSLLLNGPRPLFTSESEAWGGQQLILVGRNFQPSEYAAQGSLRARLSGANGTEHVTVREYSPYHAVLNVPKNAAAGTYTIEVTAGSGAWIPAGDQLTIVPAGEDPLGLGVAWAGTFAWDSQFPVADYGVQPDSGADETAGIQAAVNAANAAGGGVVTFPAGQFELSGISLLADVVIQGAGARQTVLVSTAAGGNFINSTGDGTVKGHHGVADLGIAVKDDTVRPDTFIWLAEQWGQNNNVADLTARTAAECFISGVRIAYSLTGPVVTSGQRGIGAEYIAKERVLVTDCDFAGYHAVPYINYITNYYTVRRCTFGYSTGNVVANGSRVFYLDNTLTAHRSYSTVTQDYDLHGLFARDRCLMMGNAVTGVGSLSGNGSGGLDNDGEAYCVEVPDASFNYGPVTAATGTTLTVVPATTLTSPLLYFGTLAVAIVDGTGLGQIRAVTAIDTATNTMTLEPAWDVLPDSTSAFTLMIPLDQVTFYRNAATDCTKGLWFFGNLYDGVAADNTSVGTEGFFIWTVRANGNLVPGYFCRAARNTLRGVSPKSLQSSLSYNTGRFDMNGSYFGTMAYGIEFRDNVVTGVPPQQPVYGATEASPYNGVDAIAATYSSLYDGDPTGADGKNVLITGNSFDQLTTAVTVTHSNEGIVVENNSYTTGVGTFLDNTGCEDLLVAGNTLDTGGS